MTISPAFRSHRSSSRLLATVLLIAVGVLAAATDILATQVTSLTFEQMVRGSSDVVVGRVVSARSRWGDASRRWMLTDYVLDIEQRAIGDGLSSGPLTITYWGGTIDGETQGIAGIELPAIGQRHLVMLRRGWATSTGSPIVGLDQGLFRIERDAAGVDVLRAPGRRTVRRPSGGAPALAAAESEPTDAMPLAEFIAWIQAVPPGQADNLLSPAQTVAGDPRVMRILRLTPEDPQVAAAAPSGSRAPRQPSTTTIAGPPETKLREESGIAADPITRAPRTGAAPAFSWSGPPNAPIVINQFPASFAPWSPEDQYQMSKWNVSATELFRVFTTPTGTYGWPNNRFDLAGWPSSADLQSVYGFSWDANTLGVTIYRTTDRIIEADIALNPAYSWTLDDEWVYNGGSAIGFRQTMVHELGHVFGLKHNFSFLSVMNYSPMEFRAYGLPFMDDAEGVRTAYASRAPARADLGVYLFRSLGEQWWGATPLPFSVVAGESFYINDYHVENAGTTALSDPSLDWYFTSLRSYSGSNWYLGTRTFFGTLPRFSYYTPSAVGTWLNVPLTINGGLYYLNANSSISDGAWQPGFPFEHSLAWSGSRIRVYPAISTLDGGVYAGGTTGTAYLNLAGLTDGTGLDVTLESSAPGIASVTPFLQVGGFTNRAALLVTTAPVSSRREVTVTARSHGRTVSGVVVVLPSSTGLVKTVSGMIGGLVTLNSRFTQVSSGAPIAGVPVTFRVSGDPGAYPAVTDVKGYAKLGYRIPPGPGVGDRVVTAVFEGDHDHALATDDGTLTVNRAPVKITLAKMTGTAGGSASATITLTRSTDKALIAGATLAIRVFGTTYSRTTNASGKATLSIGIPAGTAAGDYPVVVTFAGNALHTGGTATKDLLVR